MNQPVNVQIKSQVEIAILSSIMDKGSSSIRRRKPRGATLRHIYAGQTVRQQVINNTGQTHRMHAGQIDGLYEGVGLRLQGISGIYM